MKAEVPSTKLPHLIQADPSAELRSDALFQQIISEVEDYAMILLAADGTVLTWNKGAENIKGYKADEIIGKHCRTFYTREDKEVGLPDAILDQARRTGKSNHEGWRIRKDGSRFWANVTVTALHAVPGSRDVTGFLKLTRDLTERKVADDNFSNYVEQLKQKNIELKFSEERYHSMISEVQDYAVILLDKEGRVLDWNKGAEKLKGYTAAEIIGKNFRLFYPKELKDENVPQRLLDEAAKNGSVTHEGWRVRKDGTRFWGSVAITALHNDSQEIVGYSKVTRDLTDRKKAEDQLSNYAEDLARRLDQLRQSEERYHHMISEVQDYAIILLDEAGNIQNWNAGAQHIKGYAPHEVIGRNFRIFYTDEDKNRNKPEQLLQEARSQGKAHHEGWRVKKDGTRFWGSIVITSLHNPRGEVIGFSKVTRDLTSQKIADDALKENAAKLEVQNKILERLNDELSSFTYVASHDLKEPLRKIQIFSSRLEELPELSEKAKDYLAKIKHSASRMQSLMEALLSYSQVSNDRSRNEAIDLNEILQNVKNDLEITINEKDASILSTTLPVIEGISFQCHQLFLNLISNSLKFSKSDVKPEIRITSKVVPGSMAPASANAEIRYHQITLSDNGIGFEAEFSTKIFDAFQRLHPQDTFKGTGIGLAIVKKVMENHRGYVYAEGTLNEGATFQLFFPEHYDLAEVQSR